MRQQFFVFLIRWLLNSFGLWLAVWLFGTGYAEEQLTAGIGGFLLAGLIFSVINSLLRPFVIILSLPAILITLGLFTFVVNGFMVYLSLKLAPGIQMTFWYSILAGVLLSLINYVVSSALELRYQSVQREN
ncbi:MAG TPA: phage holin family protein [Candidatus Saccharibacteria bacterium]|nr:phage holin family protein [Candidatus Saccharibacteria bacterium]